MKIRVVNKSKFELPEYATKSAAGLDLRANVEEVLVLKPLERVLIPTGIFMEIPQGFEGQIRPRSGLAFKHGVTVLNSPGTIDADYRGEVKVLLVNVSNSEFVIEPGERVAQIVFASHAQIQWNEVISLEETDRGTGGFGSTGTR
jgi:dUTP pyrophosphatase